jgi:hypothetical protein
MYKNNVYVYLVSFPFDFSVIEKNKAVSKIRSIHVDLDIKVVNKLKAAGSILGHKDIRETIKLFIEKSLKLWEE